MPSSLVAPHTPAWVRDRHAQLAGDLERRLLGELRVAGDVERHLEAEHVVARAEAALDEAAEVGRRRPLPRALLDVAVGEHEAAGDRLQRVDGGVGMVDGLQPVRPVDGGGHARVERLDRRQQVAGVDVLGAEDLPPLQVEEHEVLGQRPVGAVPAQRGLPHVPVGVDHPRNHDAVRGVDLVRGVRRVQSGPDRGDLVADHEHVRVVQDLVVVVHGQHRAAAQHDRPAGLDLDAHVVASSPGDPATFPSEGGRVKPGVRRPLGTARRPRPARTRPDGRPRPQAQCAAR